MATTARTFYPWTTDQDQSWGTDVRKLDTSVSASENSATTVTFSGNVADYLLTVDPYTAKAAASSGDDLRTNFGWAVNEDVTDADAMDSETNAERYIPAGVWDFQCRTAITSPVVGATVVHTVEASVYRVAAGGGSRSLLFSATATALNLTSLSTLENTFAWSSSSQPQIAIAPGETIHVAYRVQGRATALLSTSNTVCTFYTGTRSSVPIFVRVPAPGIRTNHAQTITAIGKGISARGANLISAARSLSGRGATPYAKVTTASRSYDLTGRGIITEVHPVQAFRNFSLIGSGTPTFSRVVDAAKMFTLDGRGGLSRQLTLAMQRNLDGRGLPTFNRIALIAKTFSLTGRGQITEVHPVQALRTFTLPGTGQITRNLAITQPRSANGAGTISALKVTVAAKSFAVQGAATATRQGLIAVLAERSLTGSGTITEVHPVQAFRTFSLSGRGLIPVSGSNGSKIEIPLDELPTGEGGGAVIVRRPVFVFDD